MAFETNETKEQVQTDEYTEVERDLLQHREDLEQKYIDYSDKLLQDRKELTRRYREARRSTSQARSARLPTFVSEAETSGSDQSSRG